MMLPPELGRDDPRSSYERMMAGELHDATDPELQALRDQCNLRKAALDALGTDQVEARAAAMHELIGADAARALVLPPFHVEYGRHLRLGAGVFVNVGATFLDANIITLEDRVSVGPNVQFITADHPIEPHRRTVPSVDPDRRPPFHVATTALPILIERHVWIGAGAIILPGVTIGEGCVVGAGSVVTKSLPAGVVAVGNPARILRKIDPLS